VCVPYVVHTGIPRREYTGHVQHPIAGMNVGMVDTRVEAEHRSHPGKAVRDVHGEAEYALPEGARVDKEYTMPL